MSSIPLGTTRALTLSTSLSRVSNTPSLGVSYDDNPLEASKDARQIVRIAQCPQCSYPLKDPVTLPCGNSLCQRCIPKLHTRLNISYPATANRLQGFTCPFPTCKMEHAIGDCSKDVVLNKIMSVVRLEMNMARERAELSDLRLKIQERNHRCRSGMVSSHPEERYQILPGGRLLATYIMSEMGELAYDSEVNYTTIITDIGQSDVSDNLLLIRLKEAIRNELDCQVCFGVFLDPFVTTCGHTFCRKCLQRVLDHSSLCPICRTPQTMSSGHNSAQAPSIILGKLLNGLCPEAVAARTEVVKDEEKVGYGEMEIPLFICTLSFPGMPTFLHIFEPRYRLMIRRAMESGDRKFGMILHNPDREPQGNLGRVGFFQYGTMLHIESMQPLPNGHSLIETVGVSRFRVIKHGIKDNYTVGRVERIDDIPISVEEVMEARETLPPGSTIPGSRDPLEVSERQRESESMSDNSSDIILDMMSTQALFELGVSFVKEMRELSAPWLQASVFQVYGEHPDDPGMFPWWFASVLPISETAKYKLLSTESVRERLKMCAEWVLIIRKQRQ